MCAHQPSRIQEQPNTRPPATARAIGSHIDADRWPLPEDPQVATILGVESALAVSQTADECTTSFLAEDVTVRLTPLVHGFLDNQSNALRYTAKEVMASIHNFNGGVLLRRRTRDRRLGLRLGYRQGLLSSHWRR